MAVIFNYDKLKSKITEICGTYKEFADKMGFSSVTMTAKMKGSSDFSQDEIFRAANILGIKYVDIPKYFFTPKV